MITKEEVKVLQEMIAKECAPLVPYGVTEAVIYAVENYWLKQIEESMIRGSEHSTCDLANPGPLNLTPTGRLTSPTGAVAASQKVSDLHTRRGKIVLGGQRLN
jgi:hypothetical protein